MLSEPSVGARAPDGMRAATRRREGRVPRVLPIIEVVLLVVAIATPFLLSSRTDLVTLATNVLILSMLAISFDLCWGLSGIMSFGQALFFGVAGYVIALVGRDLDFSELWATLPLAMLGGLLLASQSLACLPLGP